MNTHARLFVATVAVCLASAASAKEPFHGDRPSLPFVAQARAQAAKTESYYEGELKLKYDTIPVCFVVSSELVDEFDGDPDMHHKFVHQNIPYFSEITPFGPQSCESVLQHNGSYIKTCSGFYLRNALSLTAGEVFTTLEINDAQGNRIVSPIGTWTVSRVDRCSL